MKVALPVWNSRISPLFDTAGRLLMVELQGDKEVSRSEVPIAEAFPPRKVSRLQELGVEVLICGGISWPLGQMVEASGVRLIPWMAGSVDEVLGAYRSGNLPSRQFFMPGCPGRGRRFRMRGRSRRRRW